MGRSGGMWVAHARRRILAATIAVGAALVLCGLGLPAVASAASTTGAIEGVVTNVSPAPVEEVEVCALRPKTEAYVACRFTDGSGKYKLPLAAGEYDIEFYFEEKAGSPNYATQYYAKALPGARALSFEEAEAVTVEDGKIANANAELLEAGEIEGRVTSSVGTPIEEVYACALAAPRGATHVVACGVTNANGDYTISKLAAATYDVVFELPFGGPYLAPFFYGETFSETNAVAVSVKAGEAYKEVDVKLREGGRIAGTVTNASIEKEAVEGLAVCAIANGEEEARACGETGSGGAYTIMGLPTGSYRVWFTGAVCGLFECEQGYFEQLYNNQQTLAAARLVGVTAPDTTGGIDASMVDKAPKQPANLHAPALSGTASVESTLTCSQGSWVDDPTSLSYAWLRNGSPIAGQTASTYKLQGEDEGKTIACQVTASNAAGATASTSNAIEVGTKIIIVKPRPTPRPLQKGVAVVGVIKRGHKGSVSVELRCAKGSACKGTVKILASTVGYVHGSKHQVKRFAQLVLFGSVKFSLAAGAHKTLKLRLTKKGKALLGAPMRHSLKLDVSGTGVKARKLLLKA